MTFDKKITRREAITGGIATAGVGALSLLGATGIAQAAQSGNALAASAAGGESEFDTVILGAGCAGMVCAIHAAELGLKPLLIEKMSRPAGNTMYAGGHFLGLKTRFQKEQGANTEDSEQLFYDDMIKMSQGKGDPVLTRYFVRHCDAALEWLTDVVGIKWAKIETEAYPARGRSHVVDGPSKPGGSQLVIQLFEQVKARGIPVLTNTKALELLTDDKFSVTGVKVVDNDGIKNLKARYGVVLATGGFHASEDLVTAYMGGWAAQMPIRGSRIITGENLNLTRPLYAKMVNIDQFHAGPIYGSANPSILVNYGPLVTKEGKRYIDEVNTYVRVAKETARLIKENLAFIIVDEASKASSAMVKERFARYERNKAPVYQADTIEGLAKAAGINPEALVATIKEYNDAISQKRTGELNPPLTLEHPRLIAKAPFYAFPFQGGMTATFGGPLVNVKTEVLNGEKKTIRGLYAIGNSIGGLFYDDYIVGAQLTAATIYGIACADELNKKRQAAVKTA
ncbi:FAD-dependent oxidoreductase [Brenneria populi subsp. brevivirga]|uniref:FAD-dependent oxidoreductase n=1 Tax=Brenneria populi TaxID=1505588 RepID=UPI002E18E35E|nr:FAD-dependent oxidoreductase [Brenneria populi subsp. brevivirga]